MSIEHVQEDALNMHFDGELAPTEAASVERHLATCGECNKRLHSMEQLRQMITVSAEQVASTVDFDAMFGRIEQGTKTSPVPGLMERLTIWVQESLQHNPVRVWAPAGGLALAAAAAVAFVLRSSGPGVEGEQEMARRGVIAEEREIKREKMMLAENQPKPEVAEPLGSNASEVVQVDFGSNTGTVFEIALADGASTPVVWINED